MNRQTFLDALRANPQDDVTRLVQADWLEEQGEGARADFIRTQVRLAGLDEDDPEREGLEERERDSLAGARAELAREPAGERVRLVLSG